MKESVLVYPKQWTAIICPALSLNWKLGRSYTIWILSCMYALAIVLAHLCRSRQAGAACRKC